MASTGIYNGTLWKVLTGGSPSAISFQTDTSLDLSHATRDTTSKDSGGWKGTAEGLRSAKVSGSAYMAEDATKGFDELFALLNNRTRVAVEVSTGVTGDKKYSGNAYITSLKQTAKVEESVTFDFEFEFDGAITEATI